VKRTHDRERGAAAVEFAMLIPALLIILLGAIHFGRAFSLRHVLGDATGFAARQAAIANDPTRADGVVRARMNGVNYCRQLSVTATQGGNAPYRYLDVRSTCQLPIPLGSSLLGNLGMTAITVVATMPID